MNHVLSHHSTQSTATDGASIEELYSRFIAACNNFLEGARDADMDFAAEKMDHHRYLYDKKMQDVRYSKYSLLITQCVADEQGGEQR